MSWEKVIEHYYGSYKKGGLFGKKYTIQLMVYPSSIAGEGFESYNGVLGDQIINYTISFGDVKRVFKGNYNGEENITIEYKKHSVVSCSTATMVLLGVPDIDNWVELINETWQKYLEAEKQKRDIEIAKKEKKEQLKAEKEEKALQFYKSCYDFHIKEETPRYTLFESPNKVALIYIDESRSLNFLKIDGYEEEEHNGCIAYEDIHYYEKAGNIHYTTDIHGQYTSYGGSITGGSFSKLAAVGGGLLFGLMGMGIGAALTYKPARQEAVNTSFVIESDVRKIDDRSVILNFYSNTKKQYIDIELPQEVFNFLQTYIPEKKMSIVEELEKKTVVQQSENLIRNGELLKVTARPSENALEDKTSVDSFQEKIEKLKIMKEAGLLSDEEFEEEKKKLLSLI